MFIIVVDTFYFHYELGSTYNCGMHFGSMAKRIWLNIIII